MKQIMLFSCAAVMLVALSGCSCSRDFCDTNQFDSTAFCATSVSSESGSFLGEASLSDKEFENLNVCGSAQLHHITVHQNAVINGGVSGDGIHIAGTLLINGSCIVHDAHITGMTDINGYLKATDSSFAVIQASTKRLILHNSTVDSILIRKPEPTDSEQQIVELDHSIVAGNITFEKEGGKVIARNSSHIGGTIIGGTIEKN